MSCVPRWGVGGRGFRRAMSWKILDKKSLQELALLRMGQDCSCLWGMWVAGHRCGLHWGGHGSTVLGFPQPSEPSRCRPCRPRTRRAPLDCPDWSAPAVGNGTNWRTLFLFGNLWQGKYTCINGHMYWINTKCQTKKNKSCHKGVVKLIIDQPVLGGEIM